MNWKAIAAPVAAALVVDLTAYYKARKADPTAKFRWDLFLIRGCIGFCAYLMLG